MAQIDLGNTVIRSPVNATVLERNVEVGEFVTTGFVGDRGAKGYVVSLADLTDLRVELDVSQNDFAKVEKEQPCWVTTDAYPDRKYDGAVYLISPQANRQKATVQVQVKIANPDDLLRPDMNATVAFRKPAEPPDPATTQPTEPVVTVPATAVRDNAVFLLVAGKAERRQIELGTATPRGLQIKRGLTGGEQLIVNPPPELAAGQPVKTAAEQ